MKRLGAHSASCSCTSCVYRSGSKQPSVQQLIEDGSKIDKLYYGKYLPLRERKLLEKLIRTRAVYDDVRNQLLSTSGSSDQTRSEQKVKRRDDDSTEKSSAVLKIVDLVDRGHMGSSNTSKLSSCCSCCSCSSMRKIQKRMEKHPRVHRHHVPYEDIARYTVEAEKRGRRRRRRLSTKISSKIRAVHFKMKKIRSEPCTCTLSLSSVIKRPSKAFMKKVRSKEKPIENAQAQKVVTSERKALKKKICSCSCKIAKLPMKSLKKIKNIRTSTTKDSGTEMISQRAFRIKKDSITLFREKLLRKRIYEDWECESGTCVLDECIPEQCFKKIKAKGVGEARRRKHHSRHSGTGRDRSRISMSTRPRRIKVVESRVQTRPGPILGPVICECKPSTKSVSSMTSFSKPKSLTEVNSTTTELKVKRPKSPKQKQVMIKETVIQEKAYKSDRYPPKRTKSFVIHETEQAVPEAKLGSVICECKPTTKSTYSMTTILKKQTMQSVSRSEIKVKRPVTPKPRPQFVVKETIKQEKAYKTGRQDNDLVQVSPKSNLGHVICECKPFTKSTSSMASIPKAKASKSRSKTMKSKPKAQLMIKEVVIEEKAMKLKAKPQIVIKEMVLEDKAYKTSRPEKDQVQVSPKSNLGHVICECKPSTKSISSMTSIQKAKALKYRPKPRRPKSQLVITETVVKKQAYITGRPKPKPKPLKTYHIASVPVPPKTNVGHSVCECKSSITCECKPSTKSISSMTSVPKPKPIIKDKRRSPKPLKQEKHYKTRHHKPRREPYQYHEAELQESEKQAVKISSSFKFEIEFSKKRHPALTNKELIEHVKTKRAKRIKPTHSRRKQHRRYHHSKIQVTGASQDSQVSYLRESASQVSRPSHGTVLPFPRECEPSMCIPYECDPEKCARILLSRSKSRGRSAMSSTDRLRRKSVGSTTFSQKTRSKSKYIQSKSTDSFIKKPKAISKAPPPQIVEKNIGAESSQPQRQAVRIASNFSFDIEFYKDKSPGGKTNGTQDFISEPQKKIKQKEPQRKHKDRGHGTRNNSSRNNMSSQSRSSQSFKNIQVGHRLKRCFCTLKLLQKKKQKVRHAVSKKTMVSLRYKELDMVARKQQTQTKSSGIAYVIPPVTSTRGSLLPYECEPFFCTPGECNPYDCAERIKERNRKGAHRFSKETNTAVTQKRSKLAYTSQPLPKSLSRKIQSGDNRNRKPKTRHSQSSRTESKVSSDKTERQAVRIGSSFTFNIEFSKKKHNQQGIHDKETANEFMSDKPIKKERRRLHQKGIKVYKPRVHHETSETTKYVKTKQTYTEPFLQKCLCTLKLLKKNKKKVETLPPLPLRHKNPYIMHMQNKSITANRADIRYDHERFKMLPYECEPSICVPNKCDSYIYEKLTKLRQMNLQQKYSNTGDLVTQSTFSRASRTINSFPSRNTQSFERRSREKAKNIKDRDSNAINVPSRSKQAVRVGSSFKLNIEFSKEKSPPNKSKDNVNTTKDIVKKHSHKKDKLKTRGSQQFMHPVHNEAIVAEVKHKEKGNYISSAIKRCFCTLKFYNKGKNAGLHDKTKSTKTSYPLPNPQICECKSTSTKINKPFYDLKSHECAPNFCIPGMCDPYKCYEEIKRREIKGHDRYVSTDKYKRKSVMTVTTSEFSDSSKAKSTQSKVVKHTPKKNQNARVIKKDMRSTRSFSPSRQAVRIGSNFSFNVEFSKDRVVPSIQNTTNKSRIEKYNLASETSTVNKIKDKGINDKRVALKHRLSQANKLRKEDKASNVGFLLKRCFCTLGLQKKNIVPKIRIPKYEIGLNQPITTQFVQVVQMDQNKKQDIRQNITKSKCSALNKSLYGGVPLELKLPEDSYPFKENIFGHQNNTKNVYYGTQHLSKSSSLTKRAHLRSPIDFNFDDYHVGYLINTQKLNPFFQSFYALNVKVSKLKNVPGNTHALEDNECEPGVCVPYECDPVECLKRINNRLKRSKLSSTDPLESKSVGSYKKCKLNLKSKTAGARLHNKKSRNDKSPESPMSLGSDLSIRMGIYKDTDPYKNDVIITHAKPQIIYENQNKVIPNKGKSPLLVKCLCPIMKKTETHLKKYKQGYSRYDNNNYSSSDQQSSHPSRKAMRVGSDLRIAMAFYKESNPRTDGITFTKSQKPKYDRDVATRSHSRDADSQVDHESKNKATGISHLLTRCFCTAKLRRETPKATKADKNKKGNKSDINKKKSKPEKNKKDTKVEKIKKESKRERNKKGTKPEKNKNSTKDCKCEARMGNTPLGHSVGTDYPKYKSTSSISRRKSFKSKTVQFKTKDWSSCSNYCLPKKQQHRENSHKRPNGPNVTFGSNIHFNMEFYQDRTQKRLCPEMALSKLNEIQGIGDQGQPGPSADKCKCKNEAKKKSKGKKMKNGQENDESMLDPNECKPHTCVPNKCFPIECESRINKRRLRSRNTKVYRGKNCTSVKSADTDTGTIKAKSVPKTFKECHPHDCDEKLKALGIIEPDVGKTIKKKAKRTSLSTQKDEDKSNSTNKQNKSVFKQCFCVLTMRKSKQPTIKQHEKGTGMNKKTDLNKFIEKCYCSLKHIKGGKQLTPKQSTERIVSTKKKDKLKETETLKPALKLEKKKADKREMKTIMPYSKKKFKKLDSQTKVANGSTNTTGKLTCMCDKPKNGKQDTKIKDDKNKKTKEKDPKGKHVVTFGKSGKQSLHTCFCPDKNHTCLCFDEVGDGKIPLNKNLKGLCPMCIAKAGGKSKKRGGKLNTELCTCMGDGKKGAHTCECQLGMPQNNLCPVCNKDTFNTQMKKSKRKKKKTKKGELEMEIECQKTVCPCCKRIFSTETVKNMKQCMKKRIFSVCSSLMKSKERKVKEPPVPVIDSTPLFEMLVNKNNMNILNRDEVLRNLGSSGKDSKVMKKARKANLKGTVAPPLMEMIIDRQSASIINSSDILNTINYPKRQKKSAMKKGQSLPAAGTVKMAPVSQVKSERKAPKAKGHGSKCKCCVCRDHKRKHKGGANFSMKPRKLRPCTCGSVICKKDWNKLKKEERSVKSLKIKPCVCGSDICREESQKMPDLLLEAARQAEQDKEQAKQDIINEKIYQRERKKRKKQYAIEDKLRWKARKKEDKREMKLVKKYDTASDILMVAESLIDFGSLGSKAFCDIMRSVCRVARHPRDGVYHVKDTMNDPSYAVKEIKQSCRGMGLYSTIARVKRRMLKMPFTRNAIAKMESYPLTNYLVHITDKDPKQRMKKFKNRRLREPLDFECSLFMASLRKRPCLRVYYMCPWFYPHCVGLLGIWKQFTDIILFILAVGVWSPCILCMELCRAMVCCCLCTG